MSNEQQPPDHLVFAAEVERDLAVRCRAAGGSLYSVDARAWLAACGSAWMTAVELQAAHDLADSGTDEECQSEYERLERLCEDRLRLWRGAQ